MAVDWTHSVACCSETVAFCLHRLEKAAKAPDLSHLRIPLPEGSLELLPGYRRRRAAGVLVSRGHKVRSRSFTYVRISSASLSASVSEGTGSCGVC